MKVLIVDDESDQERLIRFALRKIPIFNNCTFLYGVNGNEALSLLQQNRDIVIALIDINMPEMDGFTLLSHMRQNHKTVQTIIISAYGDMSNIRQAMNKGAFDFLPKPIDISDLEKTLLKTLDRCQEIKQNKLRKLKNKKLERQKTELQMQAFRAQMNPHFVFNCINSIDSLIMNEDKASATLYLNKFAKLLRGILNGSRRSTISIADEIHHLKWYIDLELLRHNFAFDVEYNIDPLLEKSDIEVPALLVQPIVENAILHGINPIVGYRCKLEISMYQDIDAIYYEIRDNGMGYEKAIAQRNKDTEPLGMEITKSRIKIFNEETTASMHIEDLSHSNQSSGTRISIMLKK